MISEMFKENKDSLIVDLDNNDSLLVALHNQDQDSRIASLHNNNDLRIVDLPNQETYSRIIVVYNTDSLCMYMFTYVALFWIHKTII